MNFFKNVLSQLNINKADDIPASVKSSSSPVYEAKIDFDPTDLLTSQSSDELGDVLDNITSDESIDEVESKQKDFLDFTLDEIEFSTIQNMTSDDSQPVGAKHSEPRMGTESPYPIIDLTKFFDLVDDLDGKEDPQNISDTSKEILSKTTNDDSNNSPETSYYDLDLKCSVNENYITKSAISTNPEFDDAISGPKMEAESSHPVIDIDEFFDLMDDLEGKDGHPQPTSDSSKVISSKTTDDDSDDINNSSDMDFKCSVNENYLTKTETITNSEFDDIPCSQNLFYGFEIDFEEQIQQFTINICNKDTGCGSEIQEEKKDKITITANKIFTGNKVVAELELRETNDTITPLFQGSEFNDDNVKSDFNQNIIKKEDFDNNDSDNSGIINNPVKDCMLVSNDGNMIPDIPEVGNDTNENWDSDYCSGYHSSDFEFISESEAEADGLYIMSERRYKSKIKASKPNKQNTLPSSCVSKPTTTSTDKPLPSTANESAYQRDYKSMRRQFITQEAERLRQSHILPEGQNFLDLFHGPNAPIANDLYILENKSVRSQACMGAQYEGMGFNMRLMYREVNVNDEDKREAEECAKKIANMYPVENRKRRRQM